LQQCPFRLLGRYSRARGRPNTGASQPCARATRPLSCEHPALLRTATRCWSSRRKVMRLLASASRAFLNRPCVVFAVTFFLRLSRVVSDPPWLSFTKKGGEEGGGRRGTERYTPAWVVEFPRRMRVVGALAHRRREAWHGVGAGGWRGRGPCPGGQEVRGQAHRPPGTGMAWHPQRPPPLKWTAMRTVDDAHASTGRPPLVGAHANTNWLSIRY